MSDMSVHFSSDSSEWETPQDLFDALDREYHFTLDPCASDTNHKCEKYFTKEMDGLSQDWTNDIVFMNPPYGRGISKWVNKAVQSAMSGATVVCLLPSRTDTRWWELLWNYEAHAPRLWVKSIRFIKGRLKFGGQSSSAPFPSVIVVLGR